jgi:magnesium transporter
MVNQPVVHRRSESHGKAFRRLLRRGARSKITKLLARMRPEDVAIMLRSFTPAEQNSLFKILSHEFPQAASDVLVSLDLQSRLGIFQQLTPDAIAHLLELAAVDDAVYILDSLPPEMRERVLAIVDLEERFSDVQAQLAYGDGTAGRIMDTEYIALDQETTVAEAIVKFRQVARDIDMVSYLYVVDRNGRLAGVSPLRSLLLADPEATLSDIMNSSVIHVQTETDQEEVAQLASRYDLLAIPVIDDQNRLVGIVTIDDIVDIFREEATEDFFKMAGTSDQEMVYQEQPFKVAGLRLPWILVNLAGLLFAGLVTTHFQKTFTLALLVGFVPVIMGMAGNVGSQTATIAVRNIATGRLAFGQGAIRRFLLLQLKVGALLAIVCASLAAVAALVVGGGQIGLALVIAIALFVSVQLASINGVLIPVVFNRLGFDPAVASGPLVTTTNDIIGISIYFGLATLLSSYFL